MSHKPINSKKSGFTLYCPNTQKSVIAGPGTQIPIPNDKATWWQCPECNGWHVSLPKKEVPLSTNQTLLKPTA